MSKINLPHNHNNFTYNEETLATLAKTEQFKQCSELLKLLCDSNRLRIFFLLHNSEECVLNIATLVDMSSPAVSHHLKQLKSSGLIVSHRVGKEMYYKASDSDISKLLYNTLISLLGMSL